MVSFSCFIVSFWRLRPQTPTGALPLDPAEGLPSPRPPNLEPPLSLQTRLRRWLLLAVGHISHNYRTKVINSSLVDDPTVRSPGFHLPRRQWSLLNRFRTGHGHSGTSQMKWGLTDNEICVCSDIQTMLHIVDSCLLTKLDGGLQRLYTLQTRLLSTGWCYAAHRSIRNQKTNKPTIYSWCNLVVIECWFWPANLLSPAPELQSVVWPLCE